MKKLLFLAGMLFIPWVVTAQNDVENLQKYWKFRNKFKEKYIRIGEAPGESLPAWTINPTVCIDNLNNDGTGYGEMHWGDGMIHQGYYIGFLATEYRLLKNNNQDVKGVLNELFFALNAINRVDRIAEDALENIYEMQLSPNLNGYYIREDVEEDFALNWSDEDYECRCTNSNYYVNNNAAKVHDPANNYITKGNSYQNTPSLDQLTALMVGFSLVHKLLDDVYVQPEGIEFGFYIKQENSAIVDRIIRYIADHNWFMIDVNGWPVNNGGGDCLLAAYPLLQAAERITGNTYNENWNRRAIPYNLLQHCITGKGVDTEESSAQNTACDWNIAVPPILISQGQFIAANSYNAADGFLHQQTAPGPHNNQDNSKFQSWQETGPFFGTTDFAVGLWEDVVPNQLDDIATTSWWGNLFSTLNPTERYYDPIWSDLPGAHVEPWIKDYSLTIIYNLGVVSGTWNSLQSFSWGTMTNNRANELTNAVLYDKTPAGNRSFYADLLNNMTNAGSYFFQYSETNGNTTQFVSSGQENGWKSKYRWTHPSESILGAGAEQGMFNGLDYMFYHNLVQLAFPSSAVPMKETFEECNECVHPEYIETDGLSGFHLTGAIDVNKKIEYLDKCTPNALDPVNNEVTTYFEVGPKFSNYVDYGIITTRYQQVNGFVRNGATLKVRNRMIVCQNKVLRVEPTGVLILDKGELLLNGYQSTLDVSGTVRLNNTSKINTTSQGKIILRSGAKLILEDNALINLLHGSAIEYYNGAEIISNGVNVTMNFVASGMRIMNPATLKINTLNSPELVKIVVDDFCSLASVTSGTYDFTGGYKGQPMIEIKDNSVLVSYDYPSQANTTVKIQACGVKMGENSKIDIQEKITCSDAVFTSTKPNYGLNFTDLNNFYRCDFLNVPIKATLNIENVAPLFLTDCNLEVNIPNQTTPVLIQVIGRNIMVYKSNFKSLNGSAITSSNGISKSVIEECTFYRNPSSGLLGIASIFDNSNTEFLISKSTFTNGNFGVKKSNGKITARCNTFSGNMSSNIQMENGILNLSTLYAGGYNNFGQPTNYTKNISLINSDLKIDYGYNKFDPLPANSYYIQGTVSFPCVPNSDCSIAATKNQWGSTLSQPSQSKFSIQGSNSLAFMVNGSGTYLFPACGSQNPPVNVPGEGSGGSGKSTKSDNIFESPFISTIYGDSIQLLDLQYYGISKMSCYFGHGDDLEAMDVFDAILTSGLSLEDEENYHLYRNTLALMKTAFESAFSDGIVQGEKHVPMFDLYGQKYVNALNLLGSGEVNQTRYKTKFLIELDKMELFRMLDKPEVAKELLSDLEFCGLDIDEQKMVNHWKEQIEMDLIVKEYGFQTLDSIFTVDVSHFRKPSPNNSEHFYFGAKILSPISFESPECEMRFSSPEINSDQLVLYPNPTRTDFSIRVDLNTYGGSAKLHIESIEGKNVKSVELLKNEMGTYLIDVPSLIPGTYIVRLVGLNEDTKVGKLIKQ